MEEGTVAARKAKSKLWTYIIVMAIVFCATAFSAYLSFMNGRTVFGAAQCFGLLIQLWPVWLALKAIHLQKASISQFMVFAQH